MKEIVCKHCGSKDLRKQDNYYICNFCRAKYLITSEDRMPKPSNIGVKSDVDNLLEKCKEDPSQAWKYANLILDIDPSNVEALKYL